MATPSSTREMSIGSRSELLEIMLSPIATGALERMSSCRQPGVTFAKLFEISLKIM